MTSNFSTHTLDAFARPVAGQALDTPVDQTTLVNLHSDAIEAVEGAFLNQGIYTPAVNGNGLTVSTGSIIGTYIDYGKAGVLTLGVSVTANWSGAGYLSCSLPPGWTAAGVESLLTGYAYPQPAFGIHYPIIGVIHAGLTECRFITPSFSALRYAGQGPGYCSAVAASDQLNCGLTATPAAHGLVLGDQVWVEFASTALPTGLTSGVYYVTSKNTDGTAWTHTTTVFKLATAPAGNAINITADGVCNIRKAVDTTVRGGADLPVDGVNQPFAFTGDGTPGNQDKLYVSGIVIKAP